MLLTRDMYNNRSGREVEAVEVHVDALEVPKTAGFFPDEVEFVNTIPQWSDERDALIGRGRKDGCNNNMKLCICLSNM